VSRALVAATAAGLDLAFGEPPVRLHPVVGMGRLLDVLERWLDRDLSRAPGARRRDGVLAWCAGAGVVLAAAELARRAPWPVQALALWSCWSGTLLLSEVAAVEDALTDGVDAGRTRVAWLVSRDTSQLTPGEVRSAALETLAENLNDGVVATAWWWAIGGIPAALLHRYADTADSRLGYRTPNRSDVGRPAARIDDVLAAVPARLTAIALRGVAPDATLQREAARTPSPNSGWPMAALALRLGVRLRKPDAHDLNIDAPLPRAADLRRGLAVARRVVVGTYVTAVLAGAARDRAQDRDQDRDQDRAQHRAKHRAQDRDRDRAPRRATVVAV
jgi:adenosylcobinamide-phosphate synthase